MAEQAVDMHVHQVHANGQAIVGLADEASAMARSLLSAVVDAAENVGNDRLGTALGRYHDTWLSPLEGLAHDVDALGQDIAGSAVDVTTADAAAARCGQRVVSCSESLVGRLNGGPAL